MSNDKKTHFRKAFNSPYLSSADIVEPTILTVQRAELEKDKTKRTKDSFNTLYFAEKNLREGEPLKPMILNAVNSKTMRCLTDSSFLEDWGGTKITVYSDPNVSMMGEKVGGLRINTEKPIVEKPWLKPDTEAWDKAKTRLLKDANLSAVRKHMQISDENIAKLNEEVANG